MSASFVNQDLILIFVTSVITNTIIHTLHFHCKTALEPGWDRAEDREDRVDGTGPERGGTGERTAKGRRLRALWGKRPLDHEGQVANEIRVKVESVKGGAGR